MSRALAALLVAFAPAAAHAADEPPHWSPGKRTAGDVRYEASSAEERAPGEGSYGRLQGDLDLGFALGAELESDAYAALRLSAHYFSVVGLGVGYRDGLGQDGVDSDRLLSLTIDMRPAFVARWARDHEQGPALLDLAVDAISLGIGAYWSEPPGASFGEVRGFEASLGSGLALFGSADGLWLEFRGVLRWPEGEPVEPAAFLALSFHTFALSPLARREVEVSGR
jgi:hypothetical protein